MNPIFRVFLNPTARAFKEWKSEWGNLILLLIPIALAFPIINDFIIDHWWAIGLVFMLFFGGWLHSNYQKESKSQLKRKVKGLYREKYSLLNSLETQINSLEAVPQMISKYIFHYLNLTYDDRITIYRYNNDKFIPVGRYSENRELSLQGRSEYPKNKGFIAKSWGNGKYHIDNLPNFETEPKLYLEDVANKSNMNKGVIKGLSMKSRCYFCKNLKNRSNMEDKAVVVIESLKASFKDIDKIERTLDGEFGKLLLEAIENNLPIGKGGE
ncbi:hypothetical protein [Virgibacillus salexigens]|uniref:hypothetical protein n=1 Tax=Virgibacillus salexigens TaxID=61016 RepID=UPI003081B4F6